jgi:1-acyl-sn-glycerol-3-phosphate acyltransferase
VEPVVSGAIPEGAPLWVSNHLSWLDPIVYLSLRPAAALAKVEVASYPVIGAGALKAGLRFVDRDDPFSRGAALSRLRRDLREGRSTLLFPEGTTTPGTALAPLREGGLRLAYRMGVPVLPFRISSHDPHYPWTGDATLMPHLKDLARAEGTRVLVKPGRILAPVDFQGEDAFVNAIRHHLQGGTA